MIFSKILDKNIMFLKKQNEKFTVNQYKKFMGEERLKRLQDNFSVKSFLGKWELVYTSLSTDLLGTGIDYSNVSAEYKLNKDNSINLINYGRNEKYEKVYIEGNTKSLGGLETCRKVSFQNIPDLFSGDYWIIDFKTVDINNQKIKIMIVCAPLILPVLNISFTNNFAFYTLVSSSQTNDPYKLFFSDEKIVKNHLKILKKFGFKRIYNSPVISSNHNKIINPKIDSIKVVSRE